MKLENKLLSLLDVGENSIPAHKWDILYNFITEIRDNSFKLAISNIEEIIKNIQYVELCRYFGDANLGFKLLYLNNEYVDDVAFKFYLYFSPLSENYLVEYRFENDYPTLIIESVKYPFNELKLNTELLTQIESLDRLNYLMSWIIDSIFKR